MRAITPSNYHPLALAFTRLSEDDARRRATEFLALMRRRRSVRHFSSEPVPRELIENALRTAGTAPSGANQQPWTFVAISDAAVKARIRAAAEGEEELLYRQRASPEYLHAISRSGPTGSSRTSPTPP